VSPTPGFRFCTFWVSKFGGLELLSYFSLLLRRVPELELFQTGPLTESSFSFQISGLEKKHVWICEACAEYGTTTDVLHPARTKMSFSSAGNSFPF
jgi:hypothetical protein